MNSEVEIQLGRSPGDGKIIVGGQDISSLVSGIDFSYSIGKQPAVALHIRPSALRLTGKAQVLIQTLLAGETGKGG